VRCIGRGLAGLALAAVLCGSLTGCVTGLLYTGITVPLDLNLETTPVEGLSGRSGWKTFEYVVRVDWDSAAIADAARAGGLTEIHYADMKYTSIFFGTWVQRRAIVYGR
jgi:hypothetical protein